jgi:hypothetical protein
MISHRQSSCWRLLGRPTASRSDRSFHHHVTPLEVVVAHRRQLYISAARPYHHLLVQRDIDVVVLDDAQGFADQLVALFAIELNLDLLDQLVEVGVEYPPLL